ncbi:HupE/UreJ family protein [Acuticoccus sp. MNP-M23]|uniref:HupE/UreJ family protein n=1 Tax=Acuticoccus sp. MNP-M23 TaxID=3072793 RepID=UPI00281600AF|nr:HupE/UreJ family protein [Acuticoccus sp. MNP-M23]WMS42607.1 HupE/UreJ family protein [Acuticoccus sp. MNP-M23]
MKRRLPVSLVVLVTLLAALMMPAATDAHFDLSAENRVIVVARDDNAMRIYMRIAGPLLYAAAVDGQTGHPATTPLVAPFVAGEASGTGAALFDTAAIDADPVAFAAFIASGYTFQVDGRAVDGRAERAAIHRDLEVLPFATAAEAAASIAAERQNDADPLPIDQSVVEVEILLEDVDGAGSLSTASTLPPLPLTGGAAVQNHIIDTLDGTARILTVDGQLQTPVVLNRSLLDAVTTFVLQGIHHILEGPDHVLFVLCLVAAARSVGVLLWEVTGFTIGHSVTLIAGFLGFVPAAPWFTPAIETAIALSIIFVAVLALRPGRQQHMVLITGAFGLLHGFGFSFVLHDILGPDAPNLFASLLAFNLGVEIGQLMIVVPAFALLVLLHRVSGRLDNYARYGAAAVAIGVSVIWVVERVDLVRIAVETGA